MQHFWKHVVVRPEGIGSKRVDGANGEVEFFLRAPAPRRHVLRRRRQRAVPPSWGDDPRRLRLFVIDAPIDHLGKPNRHATRSALLRRYRRIDALGRVVDGLERLRVRRAHPPERRQSRGRRGCREGAVAPDIPFNGGGGGAFPVGTFLGVLAVHRLGRAVVVGATHDEPVEESIREILAGEEDVVRLGDVELVYDGVWVRFGREFEPPRGFHSRTRQGVAEDVGELVALGAEMRHGGMGVVGFAVAPHQANVLQRRDE